MSIDSVVSLLLIIVFPFVALALIVGFGIVSVQNAYNEIKEQFEMIREIVSAVLAGLFK